MEVGKLKFTWKMTNFSQLEYDGDLYSDVFSLGPYKWRIYASLQEENEGFGDDCLSIYLVFASETLPLGWSRRAKYSFTLIDQINNKYHHTYSAGKHRFKWKGEYWGFSPFISYDELNDSKKGYVVNGTCIIETEVTMYEDVYGEFKYARNGDSEEESTVNFTTEDDMDSSSVDTQSLLSTNEVSSFDEEAKEAREIVEEALDMVPSDLSRQVGTLKFTWKIKNFSKTQTEEKLYSDVFSLGPYKWKLRAHPKGYDKDNHLSIFLEVADPETLPSGWSQRAKFSVTIIDQINNKFCVTESEDELEYNSEGDHWGFFKFISHAKLYDSKRGYLVNDTCIIETEVTMYGDVPAKSDDASNEANEENMNTFFVDMQSMISPEKIPSSDEEAKKALEVIEEALSMVPSDLNNPVRISQLRNAFEVLSSLDDFSVLTLEQKGKLLSLEGDFMDLPERAANAVKEVKLFTDKESVKTILDHKLKRYLVEFGKAKAEVTKNEQNIATLQKRLDSILAQIGETEKKKDDFLLKQKEMFKLSKKSKAELDVLVKNWPDYEAKMKAAKEEEKVVGAEWIKIKQLVSSLKKPMVSSLNPDYTPTKKPVMKKLQKLD